MVQLRSITRSLLLVAAVAASVHAEDTARPVEAVVVDAQQPDAAKIDQTCVSPDVVAQYETKVEALELERKQWEKQLVAASKAWQTEKSDLENKIAEERVLQMVAATEMTNVQKEAAAKVGSIERQLEQSRLQHKKALDELKAQVSALQKTVDELKQQLADQATTLDKRDTEVTEARARLAKYSDQVKSLERDVVQSNKKNDALLVELSKAEERLTIAALLSSYYDEGVVLADRAVASLRAQIDSASGGSSAITESLRALEQYKQSTCETTEKLYKEHLAATINPLIIELRRAADPYVKQYQPIAEAELQRAQKAVTQAYKEGLKRGRAVRADAIALLKANDSVAPYAQKIVDGALVVLLFPFAIIALRLAFSLLWFFVRTALCIVTLGFCCGRCSRKRSKVKRKGSKKPLSAAAAADATPSLTPKKQQQQQQAQASSGRRTGGGKKK